MPTGRLPPSQTAHVAWCNALRMEKARRKITECEATRKCNPHCRNQINVNPNQPICAIKEWVCLMLCTRQQLGASVAWDVDGGLEAALLVEGAIALTPWLCAALAAGAHVVHDVLLAPDLVGAELWREGHRLVGEPLVPRRRDLRRAIVGRHLVSVLLPRPPHPRPGGGALALGDGGRAAERERPPERHARRGPRRAGAKAA
eukprot:CAMPEP_0179289940 /NCGR_PEP_ID=MMETSP0797-20121207/41564_1 /TAXON_ID=47934 /ORGANISM="Dinophysis acuminata, Strain DAEP01" /LENGTH=201 /DNA_ID=CAMNT_0020998967 /DNA_START=30 /DNA_END=631 /DNA_ORIENTATION=-